MIHIKYNIKLQKEYTDYQKYLCITPLQLLFMILGNTFSFSLFGPTNQSWCDWIMFQNKANDFIIFCIVFCLLCQKNKLICQATKSKRTPLLHEIQTHSLQCLCIV